MGFRSKRGMKFLIWKLRLDQIVIQDEGQKKTASGIASGLKPAELRSADSRGRLSPHIQIQSYFSYSRTPSAFSASTGR